MRVSRYLGKNKKAMISCTENELDFLIIAVGIALDKSVLLERSSDAKLCRSLLKDFTSNCKPEVVTK
jgi:hypothetical protein